MDATGQTPGGEREQAGGQRGDAVVTRPNRGQWENSVPGHPERSQSVATREEAVELGRAAADELGLRHVVEDDEG